LIVNVDARGLEIACAAFLAQDEILIKELENDVNIHTENQLAFNLPTRLVAKVLKFRILYGGSAYSFSIDPDFTSVSRKVSYWEDVIEKYYEKYKGIYKWHVSITQQARKTGKYISPIGRSYSFAPTQRRGEMVWPDTDIKNWPVQGLGADVMAVARIAAHQRFKKYNLESLLVSTVHDSIVADCPNKEVDTVKEIFTDIFDKLPSNISKTYDIKWNVPMVGEVSVGPNMSDLH